MLGVILAFIIGGEIKMDSVVKLPAPDTVGKLTVEQALWRRRSVRSYTNVPLTLSEVGQLLWAAQGKTGKTYGRTAPSAGATYPMEIFLVAGKVSGLDSGVYQYLVDEHGLRQVKPGDMRDELAGAALGQTCIKTAPAVIVLGAEYKRTTGRYGERGIRYVHIEAGHIGQNVSLECVALGLGTVMIGAFHDSAVKSVLGVKYEPLYIMPVGQVRK
ncbi:MAG: SagB/ThcOx family dehydrogenase [bacterium]